MDPLEQAEWLDAASTATPWNVVVESAATVTERPGDANAAAVPEAAGVPVQLAFLYSWTVEPASADPTMAGVVSFDGEAGSVDVKVGAAGGVTSAAVNPETVVRGEVLVRVVGTAPIFATTVFPEPVAEVTCVEA